MKTEVGGGSQSAVNSIFSSVKCALLAQPRFILSQNVSVSVFFFILFFLYSRVDFPSAPLST